MKRRYKILVSMIVSIVLCLGMTFVSYAAFYGSWGGDLDSDYNIDSTFSSSFPYYSLSYLNTYSTSNAMPHDFTNSNQTIFQIAAYVSSGGSFGDLNNPTDFYTSSNNSIDVSNLPLVLCGRRGSDSNSSALVWHRISSSNIVSIVDNWLCSSEPFSVYSIYNRSGMNDANTLNTFCIQTSVDTVGSSGFYWFPLNSFFISGIVNASDFALMFTDIPIYMSTSSGDSGFSIYSDFSFSDENINYNYLLLDDIVSDPQAPEIVDDWWVDAKSYLNFKVSSLFGWNPDTKKLTHNMTFNWNEDMMLNPDFYVLNLSYRIVYQDQNMNAPDEFYWIADQHEFRRNLMDIANPTLNSKYFMSMDFSEFVNDSNETFLSYYLNTINSVTGTYVQNINLNTTFEDWYTTLNNYLNVFNSIEDISYKMTKVKEEIATQITTFKIYAYISVGRVADPNANTGVIIGGNPGNTEQDFRSGINVSSYNCLSAKNTVESNDNVNNLYPPEEGQLPSVISPDTNYPGNTISGGNFAQGGQGGNATVNINTDPMSGWSPEVINSIKDTFDFIEDQLSEYKDNNFLGFMIESYKLIPDPFWNMVALAGGVITGFAIIRFIRNK